MGNSVFDSKNQKSDLDKTLFFDEPVSIARYDRQKYPFLEKLTSQQLGFFWTPQEVEIYRDQKDFKLLTDNERHIFTSNLKRQILLDSVQGRAPVAAFGPICSLPELETWILTWTFSESIHSRSYTYIIRNVYPDPSKIFDELLDIQDIIDCASDISTNYDKLIEWNQLLALKNELAANGFIYDVGSQYKHKKALWLALMSVNILEGVRFYVSFACSWAFAELKKMEGNAKIIKFIARDENLHLAGTQQLLKVLPSDDIDYIRIREETKEQSITMFVDAVNQEKTWAHYLFENGSMIGLNEQLLTDYIEWIAHRRMVSVGLPSPYKGGSNPLPWTQKWIAGSEVQAAPQETEIQSYIVGGVKKDVTTESFKGFSL
jgi:ribonucleoside-diphosphate reductase beta chain